MGEWLVWKGMRGVCVAIQWGDICGCECQKFCINRRSDLLESLEMVMLSAVAFLGDVV